MRIRRCYADPGHNRGVRGFRASTQKLREDASLLPIMACEPERDHKGRETWRFPCPWCRVFHVHGAGAGHVASHCWSAAGRAATRRGYYIALDRRFAACR